MSWKDRLKQSLVGSPAEERAATPAARGAAPALRAVPAAAPGSEVLADLRAKLVELSEGELTAEAIDPAGHMLDQGYINSLSAVGFVAHVEDRWGVRIEDMDLVGKLRTLEALAAHVEEQR